MVHAEKLELPAEVVSGVWGRGGGDRNRDPPPDVIPDPVFGRPIPVTWWSYPVLVITAVLGGLLIATYVHVGTAKQVSDGSDSEIEIDNPSRQGSIGGLLSFFAVGCPVCN